MFILVNEGEVPTKVVSLDEVSVKSLLWVVTFSEVVVLVPEERVLLYMYDVDG